MIWTIALVLAAIYVVIAAWIWWMFVAHSKVGMRQTWRQTAAIARKEGIMLVLMALGWLPLMIVALLNRPAPVPKGSERSGGMRP